jgi:3-hydroxyisobutyrate dehydrogenase-like beta-hydroxyacid dehydrogenase
LAVADISHADPNTHTPSPHERKMMIRFSVLGCGRIGTMHARNLARHPQARLTSVFDVVTAAADRMAAELGVKAAASIEEVLRDTEVDAVLIATSTDTHVELITAAAGPGRRSFAKSRSRSTWRRSSSAGTTFAISTPR